MVERAESDGEEEEETDGRTNRLTLPRSPSRKLLILSFSLRPLLSPSSPVRVSRCSAGLSFSPRLRESVFRPLSPSCFTKIRNERGTQLPGELGEGSVIILPPCSRPCLSFSPPFSVRLPPAADDVVSARRHSPNPISYIPLYYSRHLYAVQIVGIETTRRARRFPDRQVYANSAATLRLIVFHLQIV